VDLGWKEVVVVVVEEEEEEEEEDLRPFSMRSD